MKRLFPILSLLVCFALTGSLALAQTTYNVYVGAPNSGTDYSTINAAVTAASSGDTIDIADANTYDEGVVLSAALGSGKNLAFSNSGGGSWTNSGGDALLLGLGVSTCTLDGMVISGCSGSAVGVYGPIEVTVTGSTLSANGRNGIEGWGGVSATGGANLAGGAITIHLTNSTITANTVNGVEFNQDIFAGPDTGYLVLTADNSSISTNTEKGVTIVASIAGNQLTMGNGCAVNDNGDAGINIVSGEATLDLTNSEASGNTLEGIYSSVPVTGTANGLQVIGNARNGILCQNVPTTWTLTGCDLDGNANWGMNQEGGGSLTASGTSFDLNSSPSGLFGGYVAGNGDTVLNATNCSFSNNGGNQTTQNFGILFWDGGVVYDATLDGCTVSGNAMGGIIALFGASASTADITTTTFANNNANGIYGGGGSFVLNDCLFDSNDSGMTVPAGAVTAVQMTDCDFLSMTVEGFDMNAANSATTLTGCNFTGNGNTGLRINSADNTLAMDGCTATGNALNVYLQGANLVADLIGCELGASPTAPGISLVGTGQSLTLDGCTLTGNGDGIWGNQNDTTVEITGSQITGSSRYGIGLEGAGSQSLTLDSTTVGNNLSHGVYIQAAGGPQLQMTVRNGCEISSNSGSGLFHYYRDATVATSLDLSDSHFDNNTGDSGINIADVAGGVVLTATNINCDDNIFGLTGAWQAQATTLDATLTDCSFSNNANNNFGWNHDGAQDQTVTIVADGCHFDNSGVGFGLLPNDGGVLTLTNCSMNGNALNGLHAPALDLTATSTTLDGNAGYGLQLWDGAGLSSVTLTASSLSNNGRGLVVSGAGVLPLNFTSVDVDANTTIGLDLPGTPQYRLTWDGGSCDDTAAGMGIFLNGSGSPAAVLDLSGVSISNNAADGMQFIGSGIQALLDNVTVDGNAGFGLWVNSGFAGLYDIEALGGTSISSNGNTGLHLFLPSGEAALTLADSSFDNNTGRGLANEASPSGFSCTATAVSFNGNSAEGFISGASGDSPGTLDMSNCEAIGNGTNGIAVGGNVGGIDVALTECTLTGNGQNNFHFVPSASATAPRTVALTSCTLNDAVGIGVALGDVALADLVTTITGCEISGNGIYAVWAPYDGEHQLTIEGCEVDCATVPAGIMQAPVRFSTLTLTVRDSDFLTTGIGFLRQSTGTLVANFEHVTFQKAAGALNPNLLLLDSGTSDSVVNIDQCDFYNPDGSGGPSMSGVWVRSSVESGLDSWAGTMDVRDSIFTACGMYTTVDASRMTQDYNLLFDGGGFAVAGNPEAGAGWTGGANNVGGDPLYRSTAFADVNYLVPFGGSPALGLNSGNGPENYAGAKGADYVEPVSPTAARDWFLY